MYDGKRGVAAKIVYNAIEKIKLSSELFKEFGLYKSEKL